MLAALSPPDVTKSGLKVAHYKMYRRDAQYAHSGIEFVSEILEWDLSTIHDAVQDTKEGYWDLKSIEVRPIINAVVIGENPSLGYMYGAPRFGDIVMIGQMASAEYLGFHKLGADTSPQNEVPVTNKTRDITLNVKRNATILATRVTDVLGIVARYSELEDWSNRG